jgi:hypothetical protein
LKLGVIKGSYLKEFQKDALQYDLTAADSEVEEAEKDTRCQSSLLTSQRNQYAPSYIFNEGNQINTFQH